MYLDIKDTDFVEEGKLYLPNSQQFNHVINNLSMKSGDVPVKLLLITKCQEYILYNRKDEEVVPYLDIKLLQYEDADILTHLTLNLKDTVTEAYGENVCKEMMPYSWLIPYAFLKENGIFHICYLLLFDSTELINKLKGNTNIKYDKINNVCDFSNLSNRGKIVLQPLK